MTTERAPVPPREDRWLWRRALTWVSVVGGFLTGVLYLLAVFIEQFSSGFSGEDFNPVLGWVAVTGIVVGSAGLLLRWESPRLGLSLTLAATLPVVLYSSDAPWLWGAALLVFAVHLTLLLNYVELGVLGRAAAGAGAVGVLVVLGTPWSSFSSCESSTDRVCEGETLYRALIFLPESDSPGDQHLVLRAILALMAVLLVVLGARARKAQALS